ncbi:unnamed protein product [Phytomonas sp. Hart1]|nr:unnamed protein product [Phytomonas sp. Hart1]|eukprot:CCW72157.1 unnamed protein product [Phytomonas sp. isolate Hart1]
MSITQEIQNDLLRQILETRIKIENLDVEQVAIVYVVDTQLTDCQNIKDETIKSKEKGCIFEIIIRYLECI